MFRNRNEKAVFSTEQEYEIFSFHEIHLFFFLLCLFVGEVSAIPPALTDFQAAVVFPFSD